MGFLIKLDRLLLKHLISCDKALIWHRRQMEPAFATDINSRNICEYNVVQQTSWNDLVANSFAFMNSYKKKYP